MTYEINAYEINATKKPITKPRLGASRKYPFDKMKIGDSFDIPLPNGDSKKIYHKMSSTSASASRLGYKSCSRSIFEDGKHILRVWRTE